MNVHGSCPAVFDPGSDSKSELTGPSAIPFSGHSLYLSPRPGLDEPVTGAASAPHLGFMKTVLERDIRCVVVLLTEEEIAQSYGMDLCEHYRNNGIEAVSYPIPDGSVPTGHRSRFTP